MTMKIISDIDYHFILPLSIEEFFTPKMKSDLALIVPDVLLQHRAGVKRLDVAKSRMYLHISAPPDQPPKKIAEEMMWETSLRLIRVNDDLKGFISVFDGRMFIKTGAKPTKKQIDDFVTISNTGI